jgi:hypothetical protein
MKIRTVYFKVSDMDGAVRFWQGFLQQTPLKRSTYWSEFKCSNINLGLLWEEGFQVVKAQANFIPVFEFQETELEGMKTRALKLGASVLVDIADHPDKKSYVLLDPFGNEFEVTKFHD